MGSACATSQQHRTTPPMGRKVAGGARCPTRTREKTSCRKERFCTRLPAEGEALDLHGCLMIGAKTMVLSDWVLQDRESAKFFEGEANDATTDSPVRAAVLVCTHMH